MTKRTTRRSWLLLALVIVVILAGAVAAAARFGQAEVAGSGRFDHVPAGGKTGSAQSVSWVTVCSVAKTARDDPIVFPRQPGMSHDHTFSGNLDVSADSTSEQLRTEPTNCKNTADRSAYWMPTLYNDGVQVLPYTTRVYYRAGTPDLTDVHPVPTGLNMIAGNAMAASAQNATIAGFHCLTEKVGATTAKQSLPPHCPPGSVLEASVVFPNCWDGTHLDSADHRSHMAYATGYRCDAAHPVQIPQVTVAERFPDGATSGVVTLASMNSPYTLHADFMDGWLPAQMAALVARCIHAGLACQGITDARPAPH